ncbi:MAG: hypothetical protein NTY76_02000 [Candidatus Omnitrophica bacterium]|nr:hypothetical protein [Candidatus Omnitrophota bacterium]
MKAKYLIIGSAIAAVLIAGGLILKLSFLGKAAAKAAPSNSSAQTSAKAPAVKKVFSKDMGGLNVQVLNARSKSAPLRAKAFRSVDSRSAVYIGPFVLNKTQELAPGSYDVELDTAPQKIYKGIRVSAGQETVEDLGCVTGILNIKTMNAKKKAASYPINVYHPKTGNAIISTTTNKPLELLAGTYDIEIGLLPKVAEAGVVIEAGKEKILDLGIVTGTLIVKAVDEKGIEIKDARQPVKVKKAGTNELIVSTKVNKPVEIKQGTYDIEIGTVPPQINKDVKVKPGEDKVVEVAIHTSSQAKAPAAPSQAKAPAAPAAPLSKIALPAKGR